MAGTGPVGRALPVGSSAPPGNIHEGGGLAVHLAGPFDKKAADLARQGWNLLWGKPQKLVQGQGWQFLGVRCSDAHPREQPDPQMLLPLPQGLSPALSVHQSLQHPMTATISDDCSVDHRAMAPGAPSQSAPGHSAAHPLLLALITSIGDVALQISPVQVRCKDAPHVLYARRQQR